jgi:hypothetical protein
MGSFCDKRSIVCLGRIAGPQDPLWVCFVALILLAGLVLAGPGIAHASEPPTLAQSEFFEAKIRPVLVEHCYQCHNSSTGAEGGLSVDDRKGMQKGGDRGVIFVPGQPRSSRLIATLRHEIEGLKMPRGAGQLEPQIIADFERWIEMGAPDPRDAPPSSAELAQSTSWDSVRERRMRWWSFQPVLRPEIPPVRNPAWSDHPIDHFILSAQEERGLSPSPRVQNMVLLRRATFALTGLPPTPTETATFLTDTSPEAYERLIDRLLESPRFGERWARHWMDLVRYCESHGSQGDPELPNAWRYRDYLIRALNNDVPYDQLVREHLAGDLLEQPRLNEAESLNESAIGTAHLRMGEFGFVPVDALDDQVKVVDNQIDVFSKAFLGLTVSCARCHHHKFDPISQEDFYALYGVFASCRPGQILVDSPDRLLQNRDELTRLKGQIREQLAEAWLGASQPLVEQLRQLEQRATERAEYQRQEKQLRTEIFRIEQPAQQAVMKARGQSLAAGLPVPNSRWSFNGDARDSLGQWHGELEGEATFRAGRLVLNGKNVRMRTKPTTKDIGEKTLEVWVSLGNLQQRAVGILTIESDEGANFDSIVYSELDPQVWIAGSDYFRRTQMTGGPIEQGGPNQLIHLAIVYRLDHSITVYRDGQLYGAGYSRGMLQSFPTGKGRILIGQRHPGNGIPLLSGELDEARFYDRALSAEEISMSFLAGPEGVSRAEILESLAADEATRLLKLDAEYAQVIREIAARDESTLSLTKSFADAQRNSSNPLHPWTQLAGLPPEAIAEGWNKLVSQSQSTAEERRHANKQQFHSGWDLTAGAISEWFPSGTGLADTASLGGEFSVEIEGDPILRGIYPAGVYSHKLSRKQNGVFTSPRFVIPTDNVSIKALGDQSTARLVIENYPLGNGGIYPATRLNRDEMGWIRLDTSYRKGSHAYFEFVTDDSDRAYFGVAQVAFHEGAASPQEWIQPIQYLLRQPSPSSVAELIACYQTALRSAIAAFQIGRMTDEEALFLDHFVRSGLLPVTREQLPGVRGLVEEYRQRDREITMPQRAPGVSEAAAFDQPLFVRGRHTAPADPVPRRFLESLGGKPYDGSQSGRRQLAEEVSSPNNPLTARVMVNRLWSHLFGNGIVGTVDNFGRLGNKPTHPELLDYLAVEFMVNQKWSIKKMLRLMMTSQTYQQSAIPTRTARQRDSNRAWLSHMPIRRLEAEAIRDSMLSASGQLNLSMYGPGVNVYFVNKTEGGGPVGPLDGDRRRSIYQRIRRNASNPFLEVFDAPKPSTTRGKRDVTNVPAQSLTMLNDPFVIDQSMKWANNVLRDDLGMETRIQQMFETALSRQPHEAELQAAVSYLADLALQHDVAATEIQSSLAVWQDFAHSLFCLKEFLYVD